MKAASIPNALTILRMLLAAPIAWLMVAEQYAVTLLVFGFAGFTDWLDGYLARRYGWTTTLGAVLDPVADKLLAAAAYVTLAWNGLVPAWLAVLVVARDVLIIARALWFRAWRGFFPLPSGMSKLNTGVQIAFVLVVLGHALTGLVPAAVHGTLLAAVAVMTITSGAHYLWTWGRAMLGR
ncbi:MAG TPA: CDP-alcohol phosphatidyltransferase family protein [Gammaproteobacteria bacterium]|nr:CDP-alcohol phosphatidyltransferase family protein [Gammaproteobacteria bacterium]